MITFFKHRKFWLPIILLIVTAIVLEIFFRSGLYNRFLEPNSLMGNSYNQISVIKKFGFNKVDWVTLGDSKTDWGIDHGALKDAQKKNNTNHFRFSLAGANFMSLQSGAEWSLDYFKNLKGIMVGMYEHEFVRYSNSSKEYKITWPFKYYLDFDRFDYFNNSNFKIDVIQKSALYNYFPDLQDLLTNPVGRLKMIETAGRRWELSINFVRKSNRDLCEFDISNLASCVAMANQFKGKAIPGGFGTAVKNCRRKTSKNRLKNKKWLTDSINLNPHLKNWTYLFDKILEKDKKLTLLLLPEYEYFEYMGKPSNAYKLVDKLILKYSGNSNFELIDLRYLFNKNNECNYYSDTLHFNSKGVKKVTEAIISKLND
jgi:hypothetical protein